MKAYWSEEAYRFINSQVELDAAIDEILKQGEPTVLFLEHDNGSSLMFGVGAVESILTYAEADGTTFHSVGDTERTGILRFWCREQLDDFLEEMAVPASVAIEAAHAFLSTGSKPVNVQWEADW